MSCSPLPQFASALATVLVAVAAPCQCALQWQSGDPVPMPRGQVVATVLWDPDGVGPQPSVLVAVGHFTVANAATSVAMYDGAQWVSLGAPAATAYLTAAVVHNGELVVAGFGTVHRYVAGAWQQIATVAAPGSGPMVEAMLSWNGQLVIGGRFDTVLGFTANNIASWNGTTWSPLGAGVGGVVHALANYTVGVTSALWVGGSFGTAGGVTTNNLAAWTGSSWIATPGCNGPVHTLAVRLTAAVTTSYLFVGGDFSTGGGIAADRVVRFNAASNAWVALGTLPVAGSPCSRLFVRNSVSSYDLVAAQDATASLWNGTAWNTLGPSLNTVQGIAQGTSLTPEIAAITYFGGRFTVGLRDSYALLGGVYSYDGVTWQTVDGLGIDGAVKAVVAAPTDVVIGGPFRAISGVVMNGVARGGPGAWQPLGGGLTGGSGEVNALLRLPNGDIVAAGSFSVATGGAANRIARWDGTAWQPLGTGIDGTVRALAQMPNGDIVAGGSFTTAGGVIARSVARWNGVSWAALDNGTPGGVYAVCALGNGDLVIGGDFTQIGSAAMPAARVAKWSSGTWSALGSGCDARVLAIAELPNGEVVVGGMFSLAGGIATESLATWDGAAWHAAESPAWPGLYVPGVTAIDVLPNGDLILGTYRAQIPIGPGYFASESLLKKSGSVWTPLFLGTDALFVTSDIVHAITRSASGEIVVAGWFAKVGTTVSANVARLTTPCPASATPYGSGCTGSGGVNSLVARTLPWDSSTLRTRASGMPAQGVALVLFGFTQVSVPLAALLAEGAPGCDLLTTPDIVFAALPVGGVLDTDIFLAPSPSLVGVTFFHQVVPFQGFGVGPLVITSTNGLALVGGSY